jgi:hypothetical protein
MKMPAKKYYSLPGGYKVGEKVFFTGTSHTFADDDKLVHGQEGEVVGPATNASVKGKGVALLFPGNTDYVECYLYAVRRLRAASTATPLVCTPHARGMRSRDRAGPGHASAAAPQP